ncbi:MAG: cation transporter [Anaerolineales bacterium]|nr:cation transporter [Anaerolineales bacterium]
MQPHENKGIEKRFIISILLTLIILIAEVIGGLWTGSLALLSDAAHVFMDVFALALSFIALRLSAMPPDDRHTYGYHRLEVLAALINGITLGAVAIGIFSESWERWQHPTEIKSLEMLFIAAIGLVVNAIVAFVLHSPGKGDQGHDHPKYHAEDINVKSAYLHVLGDAISSVGVIVAALILWQTGWQWVDPLVSIFIGILILVSSGRVLRSSLHILIEGVPEGLSLNEIGETMCKVPGVKEVHDLHVWNLCSGHIALSAHVTVEDQNMQINAVLMAALKHELHQNFGIEHTTLQFECTPCGQGNSLIVHK